MDFEQRRLHFVGMGGCGMSALATLLLRRGVSVSGSDRCESAELRRLANAGARVATIQRADTVPPDAELVVASAAIPAQHPELVAARDRGLPVVKYAALLGAVMSRCDGIAISGTHGKSTTTAWLAFVLQRAGLDPSFVVGAHVRQLGGASGAGSGSYFVAEACEFDRSFLHQRPRRAAILNIEEDHLDCYADLAAIEAAFTEFARGLPAGGTLVVNGDDPRCRRVSGGLAARVETFGCTDADWTAARAELVDGCYAFDVWQASNRLGRARLALPGRHNVYNALAVVALAHDCGLTWERIRPPLEEFGGADRRLQARGEAGGVRILDDYAHHPTEIRATLRAARERHAPQRLWCVFQPHQHSRTRFLLEDFASSFSDADHVVVPNIYFVRDSERERGLVSAEDLVNRIRARGGDAQYVPVFDEIVDRLARAAEPGDVIVTMGAGNIWKVADELVRRLGGDLPA